MKTLMIAMMWTACALSAGAAEEFRDVPRNHWAAEAVQKLAEVSVIKGYPDGTYRGDRPVTRYELAAALERMITFLHQSLSEPVSSPNKPTALPSPTSPPDWGKSSMDFLRDGGFIPAGSQLLTDGSRPVTFRDLSDALASVSARLMELAVPPKVN